MSVPKMCLKGKTVLVTGASAGIGRAAAMQLAKQNARVLIACRSLEKGNKVAEEIRFRTQNQEVLVKRLDLADFSSIKYCAADILDKEDKLDILINNAGMIGVPFALTRDDHDVVMQTNYLGPFWLTHLLLDKMKQSAPSRIVNVSSYVYKDGKLDVNNMNDSKRSDLMSYANSKLAVNLFTKELAKRLYGTGVTVNAVHPGIVKTDLANQAQWFSRNMAKLFFAIAGITPEQSAEMLLKFAIDPKYEGVSGRYFEKNKECALVKKFADDDLARELYENTLKITQNIKTL